MKNNVNDRLAALEKMHQSNPKTMTRQQGRELPDWFAEHGLDEPVPVEGETSAQWLGRISTPALHLLHDAHRPKLKANEK